MWIIHTDKMFKIWFSRNQKQWLGLENRLRLIRLSTKHPKAKLSFIYSSQRISAVQNQKILEFCQKYTISALDFDTELPKLLEEKEDLALYEIAKKELSNPDGNEAAASDSVRLMLPLLKDHGIYSDCDVDLDFKEKTTLSVDSPIIIPVDICDTKERPFMNADFIALARDPADPTCLAKEAVLKLREVQRAVIAQYQRPLKSALEHHFLDGLDSSALSDGDDYMAPFIRHLCHNLPQYTYTVFNLRKFVKSLKDEFYYTSNNVKIFLDAEKVSSIKERIERNTVVYFSGASAFYTMFKDKIPAGGFTPQDLDPPSAAWIEFREALHRSSVLGNNLQGYVNPARNTPFLPFPSQDPSGNHHDASWMSKGDTAKNLREQYMWLSGFHILSMFQNKSRFSIKSCRLHCSLMQEARPLLDQVGTDSGMLLNLLKYRRYEQALAILENKKDDACVALTKTILTYAEGLQIRTEPSSSPGMSKGLKM